MKTTTTMRTRAKRTIAGVLASLTMMTAVLPTAESFLSQTGSLAITASAAETAPDWNGFRFTVSGISDFLNENEEWTKDQFYHLVDLGVSKACDQVPIVGGLLKFTANKILGKFLPAQEVQISVKELNEKIHEYYRQLEEKMNQDNMQIQKDLICVSETCGFYAPFSDYMSMIENAADLIDRYSNQNISEEAKVRKIANLFGDPQQWPQRGTSILNTFTNSKEHCLKSGLIGNRSVFITLYDYYAGRSSSAVEATQKARGAVDYIYSQYIYGYAVMLEVLNAQLDVLGMEDISEYSEAELAAFYTKVECITDRINKITKEVFGTLEGDPIYDEAGEVVGHTEIHTTDPTSIQGIYEQFLNHAAEVDAFHSYIKDIVVVGCDKNSEAQEIMRNMEAEGWTFIQYDLNKKAGGHYIYLGYQTTTNFSEAIRDIIVREDGSRADVAYTNGVNYNICAYKGDENFCKKKGDLNCKAGGKDLMFYYTKADIKEPNGTKTAVDSLSIDNERAGAVSNRDLNEKAGGKDIFLHLTKYRTN